MLKMLISPLNYNQAKNIQHNKTVTQVCYKYMSAVVTKCLSNGDLSVGVTVALSSNRLFPSPSRATPWGTIPFSGLIKSHSTQIHWINVLYPTLPWGCKCLFCLW